MKAQCVVAHPDDCVIFARPFIETHNHVTWSIVYLTYKETDARAIEVSEYWRQFGIQTEFLGFEDIWDHVRQGLVGFDVESAHLRLLESINSDLILTHNSDGDYGHPHHKLVHNVISKSSVPQVYFASTFNHNYECTATSKLDLDQLPLHKDVISGFEMLDRGLYFVTDSAKILIKQ